ncbi:hypothetical protein V1L52_06685 [Treponema sp. HNW]|uniref:hypothetical protein n=1 Tax=Treponema sp. HNW TaxID=3116654 RepID=UPI003D0DDA52
MKKIDFIIFYEHIAREFNSVELLHSYLSFLGFSGVVLPVHFNRYKYLLKYNPKIIVTPYYYSKYDVFDNYRKLYPNTILINLHSEQVSCEISSTHMLPSDEKTKNVLHCTWGKNFAKQLIDHGVDRSKIFITGSIRNDLTYTLSKKVIANSSTILVPTSFVWAFLDKKETSDLMTIFKEEKKVDELISFTKKSRDAFFKIIYKFSQLNEAEKIILRPHPHISLDQYKEKFCAVNGIKELPENITIKREGSIQENIAQCKSLIAWNSTTALEAAMMKKKAVLLLPYTFPDFMNFDFFRYFPIADDELSLQRELANTKDDTNVAQYIIDTYYEVDGKSHIRIGRFLVDCIQKESTLQPVKIYWAVYFFVKYLLIDIPKNILHRLGLLGKWYPYYRGILMDCKMLDSPIEYENTLSDNASIEYEKTNVGTFIRVYS